MGGEGDLASVEGVTHELSARMVHPWRVAVLIPTYRRPAYLEKCVRSVLRQTCPPRDLVIVLREEDEESMALVCRMREEISAAYRHLEGARHVCALPEVHAVPVARPGPVWAFRQGIEALRARQDVDLVFVIDDDAEAEPDWIERGSRHFFDPAVGCVAGRVIVCKDGSPVTAPSTRRVGEITWYGRYSGGFDRAAEISDPIPVKGFQGVNVAFRRDVLARIEVDVRFIGYGIQFELDLAFQIRRLGYRILFDPACRVRHFEAPRALPAASRDELAHLVYTYSHNHTYLMLKHLPLPQKLAFLLYFFVRGEKRSWGLGTILWDILCSRTGAWRTQASLAFAGKWHGIRTYRMWKASRRALPAHEEETGDGSSDPSS